MTPVGCATERTALELEQAADDVLDGFRALRQASTFDAERALLAGVACVGEPVPAELAGAVHLAHGMVRWLARQDALGGAALAAARGAWPDVRLDPALAPEGHPLRALWATDLGPCVPESFEPARGLRILVDGAAADAWCGDRPAIVQLVDRDGRVRASAYLDPGEAPPPVAVGVPPAAVASGTAAVGAGALAAVAWVVATNLRADFDDVGAPRTVDELAALRGRIAGFTWASVGLSVGAAGAGAAAVVLAW